MTKYLISFPRDAMALTDEDFPIVSAEAHAGIHPGSHITGGFTVLELPTRQDAVEWARKIATACRCPQELREFIYDPES
jgi:hypothetical protein